MLSRVAAVDPGVALRARLTGFAGFLRANGFAVGGDDALILLHTAECAGAFDARVLRWSLKALLCGRGDEWRRFDPLFDAYFLPPNRRKGFARNDERADATRAAMADSHDGDSDGSATPAAGADGDDIAATHGASADEAIERTDFHRLDRAGDLFAIEALMRRFARRLKRLALRRETRSRYRRRLDLPGTIRRSVESGGTPLRLAWRNRRRTRPRLVLLLDVSRSMSAYSFFYLRLARALCAELADVHCFIFHTRITGVSEALRDPDPRQAQDRLHLLSSGWNGGTRIGESIGEFNRDHASRLVHSRTAIVIVSDGYDTGEPSELAAAMGELSRRARRIVWLNPLAGSPGYTPTGRCMQAALPYVDLFAPGADLAAIERALPKVLEALS